MVHTGERCECGGVEEEMEEKGGRMRLRGRMRGVKTRRQREGMQWTRRPTVTADVLLVVGGGGGRGRGGDKKRKPTIKARFVVFAILLFFSFLVRVNVVWMEGRGYALTR